MVLLKSTFINSRKDNTMRTNSTFRNALITAAAVGAMSLAAPPVSAQHDSSPLFEKFNLKLEGSWVGLATEVRLDSEALGRGTTLSFEDDLELGSSKTIPTIAFEWQIARRHRLGVRWQDISRDASSQALTEIQWGDEIIPVDASIALGFDISQAFLDYTFFPWVNERWAAGFGLGIRVMEVQASLSWHGENIDDEGATDVSGTGPLPYVYFEYRRLLGDSWRLNAGLGWLHVKIDNIDGGQYIGRLGIEYLLGRSWGFGGAVNLSTIDVDWQGVETDAGDSLLTAAIDMGINDVSVFARFRF